MPLIMKWGVAKIWDLILGHFWVNLSKNHDFCQNKEKLGAYCMNSLLKAGNLLRLTVYMPLIINWGFAKIWDFILVHCLVILSKNHDYYQNWRKFRGLLHAYSVKSCNLFRLTAYMPLIMKSGVAQIRNFIFIHFVVNLSKTQNHDFCQK